MTIAKAIALPAVRPGVGATEFQVVPFDVSTLADVPGATNCTADVPLPNTTLLRVKAVAPVPPLPTGSVPVTLVVKLANVVDVVPVPPLAIGKVPYTLVDKLANVVDVFPVPPLAIGKVPVTPVDRGRPVALVNAAYEGVPILGVTKAGLVANTSEPVPVSLDTTAANSAEVVAANWRRLPFFISLIATTKLPCAVVARLDKIPRVTLMLEKLLSTSKLVRGEPFAVEPGLEIDPASLRIMFAI